MRKKDIKESVTVKSVCYVATFFICCIIRNTSNCYGKVTGHGGLSVHGPLPLKVETRNSQVTRTKTKHPYTFRNVTNRCLDAINRVVKCCISQDIVCLC